MSSEVALKVENLGKCYEIYDKPRDRLKQFVLPRLKRKLAPLGRFVSRRPLAPVNYYSEFWALRDVSFEVEKGETVGIIGRNGSGKSTLLQLICGTLAPTCGRIQTNGRIAALLELGSGFNPDFTGRENVFLNAVLLGLSQEEIEGRYDDIAAFADIGDFIEQPVKSYSSGMFVRLAFAVAINVDPQILVVDEALSVGDELFQRKCFSRIEAIKKGGATVLFVSHSGTTVVELCDRAVLLDQGELLVTGPPKTVVGRYQKLLYAPENKREKIRRDIRAGAEAEWRRRSPGDGGAASPAPAAKTALDEVEEFFDPHLKPASTISYESRGALIEAPCVVNLAGERVNCLVRGRPYRYVYTVRFAEAAELVRFSMMIKSMSGVGVGGGISATGSRDAVPFVAPGTLLQVEFQFQCRLNPGTYFMNAGVLCVRNAEEIYLHRLLDICMFRVQPCQGNLATGLVDFNCVADLEILNDQESPFSHEV
jgi:lipopolysaccharide transport system ATP-binding protein